jgi:hypothetical protein
VRILQWFATTPHVHFDSIDISGFADRTHSTARGDFAGSARWQWG